MASTSRFFAENPIAELRRTRLERLLQIAAHDYELRLDFGKRDLIGEKQIVLAVEEEQVSKARYSILKGKALHLLGHYLSGSRDWLEAARREEAEGKPQFTRLWHALEDARMENWFIRKWPGSRKSFEAMLLPNLGGSLLALMPVNQQVELGLYYQGRGFQGAQYRRRVREALEDVAQEITQAAQGFSPRDSLSGMIEIYPQIGYLLRSGTKRGQGKHQQNHGEDQERQKTAESQEPETRRDLPRKDVPEIDTTEELVSVGVSGQRHDFPEWFRPGSAPWFERGLGQKEVHPSALSDWRETIVVPQKGDLETYRILQSEIQREAGFLSHRLTNIIRDEVYLRFGGYHRTGKLNMAKLWKQRIGNYRLFQRPVSRGSRSMAFSLLVDESASMKGDDKYKMAQKAAVLFGETLELFGAPLEIIGYTTADYEARAALKLGLTPAHQYRTTRCSRLEHRIYKRFDEPFFAARTRLADIQPRKNNWDEEHLLFAFQRIQERPELRKMIIIISDGQPNGDANYLIDTIRRIEALGCKVVGIGIGADFVKEIYSDAIIVSNFRQMAEELLQILALEFRS